MITLLPFKQTLNLKLLNTSKTHQLIEITLLSLISFFLPFFMGSPQILVGTIVNALLIRSALSLKGRQLLPIIFLPSLGALARGIVFGPFTVYLTYLIPFIWFSNFVIVYFTKVLKIKINLNLSISIVISTLMKTSVLFIPAFIMVGINAIPNSFLKSMGITQLITALLGGAAIVIYNSLESKILKKKND